jgi:hypothetical protein
MSKRACIWMATGLLSLLGCDDGGTRSDPASDAERDAYCGVTARADLDVWIGDFVTLCDEPRDEQELATCSAGRVAEGAVIEVAWASSLGVIRVLPAADGNFVALLRDERLVLTRNDGSIDRELAAWANDPWISEDGLRIAWVGLADGVEAWDFGVPTAILAQDLSEATPTVVTDDALASTPRPIPGTRDILYVSSEGGVASIWVGGPERAPTRLTNVGLTTIGPEFVPVPDRELAWSQGVLFYSADDENNEHRIWRLSLVDGVVTMLGPGSWPRINSNGWVLARQTEGECAASYSERGAP